MFIEAIQANQGSFYFSGDLLKNSILGLSGDVVHEVRGQGRFVLLPTMLQTVEKGGARGPKTEMPFVVDDSYLLSSLTAFTAHPHQLVKNLAKVRRVSVETLAETNKQIITRKIASHKSSVQRKKVNQKNYNDESYRLRMLFRKKNMAQ